MGQYHVAVDIDRREFISPYSLGDMLKLAEQTGSGGGVADALVILLAASIKGGPRGGGDADWGEYGGRWAGDRVAVIGDYLQEGDLPDSWIADLGGSVKGAFRLISEVFTDIGPALRPLLAEFCRVRFEEDGAGAGIPGHVTRYDADDAPQGRMAPDMVIRF